MRGRARAGRGVGEQQLHVARAHLAAVDAIGRARLALDAARHLDRLGIVEGGGRAAVGIVEHQADLGDVARRAARRSRRRSRRPCRTRACSCTSFRPSPSAGPRRDWTCRSRSGRRRRSGPARSGNRSASQKLLKPARRSRSNFMGLALSRRSQSPGAAAQSSRLRRRRIAARNAAIKRPRDQAPRPRNLCETALISAAAPATLSNSAIAGSPVELAAVDEERRRRIRCRSAPRPDSRVWLTRS